MSKKTHATTGSGAMRESIGTKIDTDLVPFELIVAAAVGLGLGEHKYEARNFEKGLSYKSLVNSIERHCKALKDGEELDADTGIPHYMLIASSSAMLAHNVMQGVIIDDRAIPKISTLSVADVATLGQTELAKAITTFEGKTATSPEVKVWEVGAKVKLLKSPYPSLPVGGVYNIESLNSLFPQGLMINNRYFDFSEVELV